MVDQLKLLIKPLVSYLTLKFVRVDFVDTVTGKAVCVYVDYYADSYLKDSRWSLFKVRINPDIKGNTHE